MKKKDVKENVLKEILKDCNFYERIVMRIHIKVCIKIFRLGVQKGFNWNKK